jgi:2-polyprenyl-3-methyl-5-hydroxy-6-metoxy-1,4-benzoquinol methylase
MSAVQNHVSENIDPLQQQAAWSPALPPRPEVMEQVPCPFCGSEAAEHLADAEEDLTGKPGLFHFVRCRSCGLGYQTPRIRAEFIGAYYDDDYIAYRRKARWGWLTPLYERAMRKLDRRKIAMVARHARLGPQSRVLDVGCGAGSFLRELRDTHGCAVAGTDFGDLAGSSWLKGIAFQRGTFGPDIFRGERFDVVSMWHFLEHDYSPLLSLRHATELLADDGVLVVEVPNLGSLTRRLFGDRWPGLQAPQHTVLFDEASLATMVQKAGLEIVEHVTYGAFPAYFYLFTGAAFVLLRGKGLNLERAILPYFAGQMLAAPLLLFETRLNLAMQTIMCRRAKGGSRR